ncbi:hypothetical protein Q75_04745 [Bacillus coahuilensis p1.1.43]|uniref:Spore coat protein CotO n=1 Tax=Bacillus coahuilensis p1.1.43 TaxID=1150625 RepID=A0A147KA29_9BACI|nr:CotO family spore coat protein [Bacillus coahuilensis]KUP07543.1 hypothetical protein Q75_04745 [Bacillus coahuilensis p1.1.43]
MKKSANRSKQTPLLYVQQPTLTIPEAKMQGDYSTRKKKKKENIGKVSSWDEPRQTKTFTVDLEPQIHEETVEKTEQPISRDRKPAFQRVKPFKEMDVEERLLHLNRFKGGKAPFPCTFVTNEGYYKGILVEYENDTIEVKPFQGEHVTFHRRQLEDILLIGLS